MSPEVVTDVAWTEHPDVMLLAGLTDGTLQPVDAAAVTAHLDSCALCRIAAYRVRDTVLEPPSSDQLAALASAAPTIPESMIQALSAPHRPVPQSGELWRAGTTSGELVWIRRVLDDALAVLPVTFDTDFADDDTLLIAESDSPLGIELAVFTALEAHIDPSALLHRYAALDITRDVEEIRSARRARRAPAAVAVGAPVRSAQDQRLEYRRELADRLAVLSPEALHPDTDSADDSTADGAIDLLGLRGQLEELAVRRRCRHEELQGTPVLVGENHRLLPVALVTDLDAVVLVAVLTGSDPAEMLTADDTAAACDMLRHLHPDADDFAVTIPGADWPAVVIAGSQTHTAVETPQGHVVGPRVPSVSAALLDVLSKHLDSRTSPFDDDDPVELPAAADIDLSAVTTRAVADAITTVTAEGQRAHGARRLGYSNLDPKRAEQQIAILVTRLIAGSDAAETVSEVLDGPSR